MTKVETAKIIDILQINYPDNFRGKSEALISATVALWATIFARDPYPVVQKAVLAYMETNTGRFMPNVGEIREQIRKLTGPEETGELEAWGLVAAALKNGLYGYEEEYAKLPPTIQRTLGSAATIREWAQTDTETVQSVIASNFMRSYRAIAKSEAEWAKLPPGYREEMRKLSGQMFGRLDGEATGGGRQAIGDGGRG